MYTHRVLSLMFRSICNQILRMSPLLILDKYRNCSSIFSELPPAPLGIAPKVMLSFLPEGQLLMLTLPQPFHRFFKPLFPAFGFLPCFSLVIVCINNHPIKTLLFEKLKKIKNFIIMKVSSICKI